MKVAGNSLTPPKNDRYAVVINVCCLLFMFVNMGIASTTFSVFQPYINTLPFMTDTLGSWLVALRMFSAFLITFGAEEFYTRFNCRLGVFLLCMLVGLSMVLYAIAPNFLVLCLGSVCSGIAYGLGGTVAMTLVIGRWFVSGKSTALGIASMGSGVAAIVLPPVLTRAIEDVSLQLGFLVDAGICVAIALIVLALLRNYPPQTLEEVGNGVEAALNPDKGTGRLTGFSDADSAGAAEAAGSDNSAGGIDFTSSTEAAGSDNSASSASSISSASQPARDAKSNVSWLPRRDFRMMQIAILLLGIGSLGLNTYLAVFMRTSGFDAYTTAFLVSVSGMFLMVSKPINGMVIDRIGSYKGTAIFFAFFITGTTLLCFMPLALLPLATAAVAITYSGQPLSNVGISTWAIDFSDSKRRANVIERFQLCYTAGSCICNLFPGLLYDLCGTYLVSYVIFALCIASAAILILRTYRRNPR